MDFSGSEDLRSELKEMAERRFYPCKASPIGDRGEFGELFPGKFGLFAFTAMTVSYSLREILKKIDGKDDPVLGIIRYGDIGYNDPIGIVVISYRTGLALEYGYDYPDYFAKAYQAIRLESGDLRMKPAEEDGSSPAAKSLLYLAKITDLSENF